MKRPLPFTWRQQLDIIRIFPCFYHFPLAVHRRMQVEGEGEFVAKEETKVDNTGIDPVTYRMQSDRSTIWANYPSCVFADSSMDSLCPPFPPIKCCVAAVCWMERRAVATRGRCVRWSVAIMRGSCALFCCCRVASSILFLFLTRYLQRNPNCHVLLLKPKCVFLRVVHVDTARSRIHCCFVTSNPDEILVCRGFTSSMGIVWEWWR